MQTSWVIGLVTICDKFKYKLVHMSIVPPPPPQKQGVVSCFGNLDKEEGKKKLLRNRGIS